MKLPNERSYSPKGARRRLPEPAQLNLSVEAKAASVDLSVDAVGPRSGIERPGIERPGIERPGIETRSEVGDEIFDAPSIGRTVGRRRRAIAEGVGAVGVELSAVSGTVDGPVEVEDEWDRYGQLAGSVAGAEPGAVFWKEKRRSSTMASLNSRLRGRAELLRRSSLLVAGIASLMLIGVLVLPIGGSGTSGPVALGAGSVDDYDRASDGTFDPASARATTDSADQGEAAEHRRVEELALADGEASDDGRGPGSIDSAEPAGSDIDSVPTAEAESTLTTEPAEPTAEAESTLEPAPVAQDEPVTAPSSPAVTAKAKAGATTSTEEPTTSTTAEPTTTPEAPVTAEAKATTTEAPTTSTTAEATTSTEEPTTSTTAEPTTTPEASVTAEAKATTTEAPTTEAPTTAEATTTTAESTTTTDSVASIAESVTTIAESTSSTGGDNADSPGDQTGSEVAPDSSDPGVIVEASVDQVGAL